jgi:hypothetical protein
LGAKQKAAANNIELAISNPCFELWLLLHFRDQRAHIERHLVQSACKEHMPGYEKEVPFEQVFPRYPEAVQRAAALEHWQETRGCAGENPSTGVRRLTERIMARQHLGELPGKLWPTDERRRRRWMRQRQRQLDGGRIESLVRGLRALSSIRGEAAELVRHPADYFAANAQRMRYPTFRRQHLFVGSGVVVAGCKTIIGSRLKRARECFGRSAEPMPSSPSAAIA